MITVEVIVVCWFGEFAVGDDDLWYSEVGGRGAGSGNRKIGVL